MSWVAEILRKQHRVCRRCRMGPTHLYDAAGAARTGEPPAEEAPGTALCHACLEGQMVQDFSRFTGRCLVFEPSLGPDAYLFHPLGATSTGGEEPEAHVAARRSLDGMRAGCAACGGPGRFLWVPVAADANLWSEDWLASLRDGTLSPGETLCGSCAARRLARSLDERGLYFEAIGPPSGGDGALFGSELY